LADLLVELSNEGFVILLVFLVTTEDTGGILRQFLLTSPDLAGWTSYWPANSATVCSPLSASKATRALNAGLCFLRFCFNVLLLL
jgi:hypothetical protein